MIIGVTGKPGGGKSYWAVREMIDVLVNDPRVQLVTNLPLRLDRLNELVQRRWPDRAVNVMGRVTLLSEEQVGQFWRHRGNVLDASGAILRASVVEDMHPDGVQMVRSVEHPVVYCLDEMHLFFNAREWARTGKAALWYASQHRKFGDDVFWVSQYHENVDKQFRVLTAEWVVARNLANETWFGWIKAPNRFQFRRGIEPPAKTTGKGAGSWSLVTLDPEIAACYDTSAGQGVRGGPPVPRRRRGLHPALATALVLILIISAAVGIPLLLGQAIGKGAKLMVEASNKSIAPVAELVPVVPASPAAPKVAPAPQASPLMPPPPSGATSSPPLRLVMVAPDPRTFLPGIVGLSDGRVLRLGRDSALTAVSKKWAVVDGQRLTF